MADVAHRPGFFSSSRAPEFPPMPQVRLLTDHMIDNTHHNAGDVVEVPKGNLLDRLLGKRNRPLRGEVVALAELVPTPTVPVAPEPTAAPDVPTPPVGDPTDATPPADPAAIIATLKAKGKGKGKAVAAAAATPPASGDDDDQADD
jgi:hypothetical protein